MTVDNIKEAKEMAAHAAVVVARDIATDPNDVIGLGTGSTVDCFIKFLAEAIKEEVLPAHPVYCSSIPTMDLCQSYGFNVLPAIPAQGVKIVFDGADEIDGGTHALIKGGGAATLAEKDLVRAALRNGGDFVVIATEDKMSKQLGTVFTYGVPVHIRPEARLIAKEALEEEFQAKAILRTAIEKNDLESDLSLSNGKAGCYGNLYTRENDFIIDVRFDGKPIPLDFNEKALKIPGVVGTGLFANEDTPSIAVIADSYMFSFLTWKNPKAGLKKTTENA